ncbi:MAG: hypothetical protein H7335_09330 [Massilia sp.]|nr:hypothetical protein [Massilia sp.]
MNIEKKHDEAGSAPLARPVDVVISPKELPRRQFAKGIIGTSGVLLTLASQPGMAATLCRSPSGSLSGGLQSHGPVVACAGRSPNFYKENAGWPSPCTPGTTFSSVFPCAGLTKDTYGASSTTLGLILDHQDFDTANLGMHLVATYLNILSGRIDFLTLSQVQSIWYDWQTYGYYSPTAGVQWRASDIVIYLSGTMS